MLANLKKPEYLFRPRQIGRRLLRGFARKPADGFTTIELPWGLPLRVNVNDGIGKQIWLLGVLELGVSEILWRLTDPGELAVDVGGNIGHMASLLAVRVGKAGRVLAFEPHPLLFAELLANGQLWASFEIGKIDAVQAAVTDNVGNGTLAIPDDFANNRGSATLTFENSQRSASVEVTLQRLDHSLGEAERVGVMKIDVEGHELAVLRGSGDFITSRKIRDIVFEEHRPYPNSTTSFLEENGYAVFAIHQTLWGPRLCAPGVPVNATRSWTPPSFLATADVERANDRLSSWGWLCLSRGSLVKRRVV